MGVLSIGADLGSTYSCFAVYDPVEKEVVTKTGKEGGGGAIPSLVCLDDCDDLQFGNEAKEQQLLPDVRLFRAFKMLLPEMRQDVLQDRGYDSHFTPQMITQNYLDHYLKSIAKHVSSDHPVIDRLVICAPEIWSNSDSMQDGRPILKEICSSLDYVKHVTVVSEPAAAAAYFAYNYNRDTGNPYNGYILIIDYGGGTLDITLTDVKSDIGADGTAETQIQIMDSVGAGENQKDGQVGDAAIAFMEELCLIALKSSGRLEEGQEPDRIKFKKMFGQLENKLLAGNTIDEIEFQLAMSSEAFAKSDDILFKIPYDGAIGITGRLLYEAYQKVIQPVLDEQLDAIIEIVERWKDFGDHKTRGLGNYTDPKTENFKIALVGGFGSFGLVKEQVRQKFGFSGTDRRKYDISADKKECAVALGAGLIAGDVIRIVNTADRSLCIRSTRGGQEVYDWAIQYRQEIKPGEVYYICHENGTPVTYFNPERKIETFATVRQNGKPRELLLKEELREKLQHLPIEMTQYGFSVDESGVYYFHVLLESEDGTFKPFGEPIRLDQAKRFCSGLHQVD